MNFFPLQSLLTYKRVRRQSTSTPVLKPYQSRRNHALKLWDGSASRSERPDISSFVFTKGPTSSHSFGPRKIEKFSLWRYLFSRGLHPSGLLFVLYAYYHRLLLRLMPATRLWHSLFSPCLVSISLVLQSLVNPPRIRRADQGHRQWRRGRGPSRQNAHDAE